MIHNSQFSIHRFFFFLLLVFLPAQLGYHFWPEWALVLGRRIDYLAPTVFTTDILIFVILFFWFIRAFQRIRNYESGIMGKKKTVPSSIIHYSLFTILFAIFVVFNIADAASPVVAAYKWLKILEFGFLGLYIVKTKPSFPSVVFFLSIGVFYSSIIAIAQFFLQRSIGGPLWWLGERTFTSQTPGIAQFPLHLDLGFRILDLGLKLRPYATFPHPNVLGGFLAAMLPLTINLQIYKSANLQINSKIFKILKGITIALGLVALALTFSRSAWAVGIVAIVFTIARIRNRESGIMGGRKTFSFSTIIHNSKFIILPMLIALGVMMVNPTEESVVVRQQLNAAAIAMWQHSPLVGVGLGNFLVDLPRSLPTRGVYFLQPVHNIYLLVLAEGGIVGLALFLLFLWYAIRRELRITNHELWGKRIRTPPMIHYSLFTILILGLVDHYPLTLQQGQLLFTIFFALSLSRR